jgi:hypothetical protein
VSCQQKAGEAPRFEGWRSSVEHGATARFERGDFVADRTPLCGPHRTWRARGGRPKADSDRCANRLQPHGHHLFAGPRSSRCSAAPHTTPRSAPHSRFLQWCCSSGRHDCLESAEPRMRGDVSILHRAAFFCGDLSCQVWPEHAASAPRRFSPVGLGALSRPARVHSPRPRWVSHRPSRASHNRVLVLPLPACRLWRKQVRQQRWRSCLAASPRSSSPRLTAALLMGFEFVLTHWAALYIAWFLPVPRACRGRRPRARRRGARNARATRPPRAGSAVRASAGREVEAYDASLRAAVDASSRRAGLPHSPTRCSRQCRVKHHGPDPRSAQDGDRFPCREPAGDLAEDVGAARQESH